MSDSEEIRALLVQTYNNYADERSSKSETEPWKAKERAAFLQAMQDNNCLTMLEVGAGPGKDSIFFKEHGFQVVCTFFTDEKMREMVEEYYHVESFNVVEYEEQFI